MGFRLSYVPKNWNPDDPEKISQWMNDLPDTNDYETTMNITF